MIEGGGGMTMMDMRAGIGAGAETVTSGSLLQQHTLGLQTPVTWKE